MNEQQIEALVVRLVGDASSYTKMLTDAGEGAKRQVGTLEKHMSTVEGYANKIKGYASSVLGALGSIGVSVSLWGAFNKFKDMEVMQVKLKAAISGNTSEIDKTVKSHMAWAEATAKVTMSSKGEIIGLLKQAEVLGVTGPLAQKATKDAMALAAATEVDASTALKFTTLLAQGDMERAKHMVRMIPGLKGITSEYELQSKVAQKLAIGQKTLNDMNETAAGKIHHMEEAMAKFAKEAGGVLAGWIVPWVGRLEEAVKWLNQMDAGTRQNLVMFIALAAAVGPLIMIFAQLKTAVMAFSASSWAAAGTVVAWAAVAVALYQVAKAITNANDEIDSLKQSMKENEDIEKQFIKLQEDGTAAAIKRANALKEQVGPKGGDGAKKESLQKEIDRLEKEAEGIRNRVAAQPELNWAERQGKSFFGMFPGGSEANDAEQKNMDDLKKKHDAIVDAQKALKDEMSGVNQAKEDVKLAGQVDDFLEKLREQREELEAGGGALEKFKAKHKGLTDQQVTAIQQELDNIEALKEQKKYQEEMDREFKKMKEDIAGWEESLQDEITALQENEKALISSADAAKLHRLAKQGATEEELMNARSLAEAKKAAEDLQRAQKEGDALTKSLRTPQEKYNDELEHLQELVDKNAITQETYNKAATKAWQELQKVNGEMGKLEGVSSRSAEAFARVGSWKDMLAGKNVMGPPGGADAANRPAAQHTDRERNADGRHKDVVQGLRNIVDAVRANPAGGIALQPANFPHG